MPRERHLADHTASCQSLSRLCLEDNRQATPLQAGFSVASEPTNSTHQSTHQLNLPTHHPTHQSTHQLNLPTHHPTH
ncbi:hypothetical protein Pcinc_036614 [Petrolisthes cinctipes]|uniref:Uncharacterized protein n=1 Tax=Petrolisthes cinctipes TaxID=88211 RepID=A0AAE1EME4_PETCI|nr:hypothetical protein Pcinc_036614 [Petrolisthes cinctipes]